MEFCPECGKRLILNYKRIADNDDVALICSNCGYKKYGTSIGQKVFNATRSLAQEDILVIDDEEAKIRTMPTTKIECPKCGNHEAYWWMVQTRGADESSTQFFRCTQCDHTWREMA